MLGDGRKMRHIRVTGEGLGELSGDGLRAEGHVGGSHERACDDGTESGGTSVGRNREREVTGSGWACDAPIRSEFLCEDFNR